LNPELAANCYVNLAEYEELFGIKAVLFYILANQLKAAKDALKRIPKKPKSTLIHALKGYCEDLTSYRFSKLLNSDVGAAFASANLNTLFTEAFDVLKAHIISVERLHAPKYPINETITVQLKIKNLSDLWFHSININDELSKKTTVDLISPNKFYFTKLQPRDTRTCEYELAASSAQKLWFKNGRLTFEDPSGNHYVVTIPPTSLQIK
jgi:hypothetical protein